MAVASENAEFQEDDDISDEENYQSEAHKKLLQSVAALCNKQRIEPENKRLDVNQVLKTSLRSGDSEVSRSTELVGSLRERASLREIKHKAPPAIKKIKKSLEKIEEDKIKRIVGYKNVKKDLSKWSSIVERNKLAPQLTFPILEKKVEKNSSYDFLTTFKEPTELEKEMAKILNSSQIAQEERKQEEELSNLTIEEMIERRNMTAKMRARESYRISKAIRQNKIKSKKYHRILKKEKMKQELKDFEKLQKTDPEAALEKLEQIERARAEERISLRHKNTGKWARSKAIRAKYDTEARIQLAEQLAKSRELTRKVKAGENSSSESESENEPSEDENDKITNVSKNNNNPIAFNPWVEGFKQFMEINEKSKGKSYEKNNASKVNESSEKNDTNKIPENSDNNDSYKIHNVDEEISCEISNFSKGNDNAPGNKENDPQTDLNSLEPQKLLTDSQEENNPSSEDEVELEEERSEDGVCNGSKDYDATNASTPPLSQSKQTKIINGNSKWEITEIKDKNYSDNNEEVIEVTEEESSSDQKGLCNANQNLPPPSNKQVSLNDIFEEAEDILQEHASKKLNELKLGLLSEDTSAQRKADNNEKEPRRYEPKRLTKLHEIDAALIEVADEGISSGQNDLRELKEKLTSSGVPQDKKEKEAQIDPSKLINVKPQKLSAELPDFDESGDLSDDEEEKKKHLNLFEAFAEDDIVDQFRNEKKQEAKGSQGKNIDLSLPGWGSWGGTGVKTSKRKTRRFFVRIPKIPRKDEKKRNVIINEDPVPKLREQLVSEIPYPFTSVKDFEASIRAPIGKHWVSEKGFRKLTAPAVITKMGTIIEPMSSSMLVEQKPVKKRPNDNKQDTKFKKRKNKQ